MIITGLRSSPLNNDESTLAVTQNDGALVTFAGVTRADHNITALFYETWAEQAEAQLREIAHEAMQRWTLHGVVAVHRVGRVPIGETSVLCATAAAHRDEAFISCRFVIDAIKDSVAIWKQEEFADRESRWVGIPDVATQT